MKTALTVLAVLLIAGAVAAFFFLAPSKDKDLEKQTAAFVSDAVTNISRHWNPRQLERRAEPGLIDAMTSQGETLDELFEVYGKLGALKDDPDCQMKSTAEFEKEDRHYTTVTYDCEAEYMKGHATVLLTVRKADGDPAWKIYYINISSPYFSELNYPRTK